MAIKEFKRIENYFSSFKKVQADIIDSQFNMIAKYLNQQPVKDLNKLIDNQIPGSNQPGDVNKFLQNSGDGNTKWTFIDTSSFHDNSLSLSKLIKPNPGSVLATDDNQILEELSINRNNYSLISKVGNAPIWQKLTGVSIEERTITGEKVADHTLTNDNLPSYLIESYIADDSITGDKFQNGSITFEKIANQALTQEKLRPDILAEFSNTIWEEMMPDNYISNLSALKFSLTEFNHQFPRDPFYGYRGYFAGNSFGSGLYSAQYGYEGFCAANLYGTPIETIYKVKENSIDAQRVFLRYLSNRDEVDLRGSIHRLLEEEAVGLEHLLPELRNQLKAVI